MKEPPDKVFDNAKLTIWMVNFERALEEYGMSKQQALQYRDKKFSVAVSHFVENRAPEDAAAIERVAGSVGEHR